MRKNPKLSEQRKGSGNPAYKHGMHKSPEYGAWTDMKLRCYQEKHQSYFRYGGRGIKVCDRWLESFEKFYADMGKRPEGRYSLDRIDNNGNYEPSNCRWATFFTQMSNTRRSSTHPGVSFNKARKKWIVFLGRNYIGRSSDLNEAIMLRKQAEVEYGL